MRIIGGDLKGKKVLLPEDSNTRPLRDMVKESIFNILTHSNKFTVQIENSKIMLRLKTLIKLINVKTSIFFMPELLKRILNIFLMEAEY